MIQPLNSIKLNSQKPYSPAYLNSRSISSTSLNSINPKQHPTLVYMNRMMPNEGRNVLRPFSKEGTKDLLRSFFANPALFTKQEDTAALKGHRTL
ncbi:MAG TPA: hypothetical protein V6C96_01155, partial [Vampirovibrionales bacterium]